MTVRGCFITRTVFSSVKRNIGWMKNTFRSRSRARSISRSAGWTPAASASAATVEYGGIGRSITNMLSYSGGRTSAPTSSLP